MKPQQLATGMTALRVLAIADFGSILAAAAAVKVHPNTMSAACNGCSVSEPTQEKLERVFGRPWEELRQLVGIEFVEADEPA